MTTLADQQREMWNAAAAGWVRADEYIERSLCQVARWLCDALGSRRACTCSMSRAARESRR